jgi:hypothetical protein
MKDDFFSFIFWLNRLIDILFFIDMAVTCNTAVPSHEADSKRVATGWEGEDHDCVTWLVEKCGCGTGTSKVEPLENPEPEEADPEDPNTYLLQDLTVFDVDRWSLLRRYWRSGWLLIDSLAIFPFYLLNPDALVVRLIRLCRFVKLAKIARSMDVLRVWQGCTPNEL